MRRRQFISLLGGAASWPLSARAQSSPGRPLVGVLSPLSAAAAARNISAFRSGLRDHGYVDGRNVTLKLSYADGLRERLSPLASELVSLKPEVLVGGSNVSVSALTSVTGTIPIVGIVGDNPVTSGLANSIARPGGHFTGTWMFGDDGFVGKRLEFLQLAVPRLSRVGLILNPDDRSDALAAAQLPVGAKALNITVQILEVRDSARIEQVLDQAAKSGVQALLVGSGPTMNSRRTEIASLANLLRLPASYGFREFVEAGGLMSYGPSLPDVYRQSARLVTKILKGENPADLPIEIPTRYEMIVNLKVAKAIGLTISDSFLLLADEVIE